MPNLEIKHATQSTKPDSPDSSMISSSEWNASAIAVGGSHGQSVVISGSSPTGLATIDGASGTSQNESYSGASPSPDLADTVITFTTAGFIFVWVNVIAAVGDSSTVAVFLKRNGVVVAQYNVSGDGKSNTRVFAQSEAAGSTTWVVNCTLGSSTFTNVTVNLVTLKLGSL